VRLLLIVGGQKQSRKYIIVCYDLTQNWPVFSLNPELDLSYGRGYREKLKLNPNNFPPASHIVAISLQLARSTCCPALPPGRPAQEITNNGYRPQDRSLVRGVIQTGGTAAQACSNIDLKCLK